MTAKFNPRDMAQLDALMEYSGPFFYATVVNAVPALIEEVKRLNLMIAQYEYNSDMSTNTSQMLFTQIEENERLRDVLEFYASQPSAIGHRAREALKAEGV